MQDFSNSQTKENSVHVIDGKCMHTYYRIMLRPLKEGIENVSCLLLCFHGIIFSIY